MNCLELERLLDPGEPDSLPSAARAHVAGCARCERSVARARSLERALESRFASAPPVVPPADFVDRVLARVERSEARGVRWLTLTDALPWWTRAAAEPGVALAMGTAALVLWRGDRLIALACAAWPAIAGFAARASGIARLSGFDAYGRVLAGAFVPVGRADWSVLLAVTLAVAPLVLLAGYGLWRLAESLADGPAPGPARPR